MTTHGDRITAQRGVRIVDDYIACTVGDKIFSTDDEQIAPLAPLPCRVASAAVADRCTTKKVTLNTEAGDAGRLWADRQRLTQVLGNLLDNALRHTPAGGQVTLTAARTGGEVVFTVADDGEGIAAEYLPHIFERFYRADTARDRGRGGSGIGLAIAKALTEAHGGHINVASRGPGHGSTFTVAVPIRAPGAAGSAAGCSDQFVTGVIPTAS